MGGSWYKKLRHVSFTGIEEMEPLEDIHCGYHVGLIVQEEKTTSGRKRLYAKQIRDGKQREECEARDRRSGRGNNVDKDKRNGMSHVCVIEGTLRNWASYAGDEPYKPPRVSLFWLHGLNVIKPEVPV